MAVAGRAAMTWEAGRTRWKIRYKKVAYVVSCNALGMPPNKLESYRAANAWWERKKAELDAQGPTHHRPLVISQLERRRDWAEAHGERDTAKFLGGLLAQALAESEADWTGDDYYLGTPESQAIWHDRIGRGDAQAHAGKTVGENVDRFLEGRRARHRAGLLSASQVSLDELALRSFADWIGRSTPVGRIDAARWDAWYHEVLGSDISVG